MKNSQKKQRIIRNLKKAISDGKSIVLFDKKRINLRVFSTKIEEQSFISSILNDHYLKMTV